MAPDNTTPKNVDKKCTDCPLRNISFYKNIDCAYTFREQCPDFPDTRASIQRKRGEY